MAQTPIEINDFLAFKNLILRGALEKWIMERAAKIFAANQVENMQEYLVYFKDFRRRVAAKGPLFRP